MYWDCIHTILLDHIDLEWYLEYKPNNPVSLNSNRPVGKPLDYFFTELTLFGPEASMYQSDAACTRWIDE